MVMFVLVHGNTAFLRTAPRMGRFSNPMTIVFLADERAGSIAEDRDVKGGTTWY